MKTVIELAKECGVHEYGPLTRNWSFELSQLERFAALVAAEVGIEQHKRGYDAGLRDGEEATKEKAAKVCEERSDEMKRRAEGELLTNLGKTVALEKAKTLDMCAAAIRSMK